MHPIWIWVTPLVLCDEELGDGCVSSEVDDCAAVPVTCTVTLSWTAPSTWLTPWQWVVQPDTWTCEMAWMVVLDAAAGGGGVVPVDGAVGLDGDDGVWVDADGGVCAGGIDGV
jgi:hypothetical protein